MADLLPDVAKNASSCDGKEEQNKYFFKLSPSFCLVVQAEEKNHFLISYFVNQSTDCILCFSFSSTHIYIFLFLFLCFSFFLLSIFSYLQLQPEVNVRLCFSPYLPAHKCAFLMVVSEKCLYAGNEVLFLVSNIFRRYFLNCAPMPLIPANYCLKR